MSTTAICPNCLASVQFRVLPIERCLACGRDLPDQLRAAVEAAIRKEKPRKPTLLTIGMIGSGLVAGLGLVFLATAPFDIGNYTINHEEVTGPEFLRRAGLMSLGGAAVCGAVAYGLATDRLWSRPLMLIYWLVVGLGSVSLGDAESAARSGVLTLLALAFAALYLYGKDSVAEYYDDVRERRKPS